MAPNSTRARRKACRHEWVPRRRGAGEVCALCGDRFPCRSCEHLDCAIERNPPPPGARRFALLVEGGFYLFAELAEGAGP